MMEIDSSSFTIRQDSADGTLNARLEEAPDIEANLPTDRGAALAASAAD